MTVSAQEETPAGGPGSVSAPIKETNMTTLAPHLVRCTAAGCVNFGTMHEARSLEEPDVMHFSGALLGQATSGQRWSVRLIRMDDDPWVVDFTVVDLPEDAMGAFLADAQWAAAACAKLNAAMRREERSA